MASLPKDRKRIFLSGVLLIVVFSLLVGLLNVGVLYMFGVPLIGLIVGVVLIWFARISVASKFAFSFLPFPLIIGSFLVSLFLRTAEAETFLIPSDYRGEVVVFYAEPCGEPPRYEGANRLYQLSSEGVLITQATKNDGYLNRKFYLLDQNGVRVGMPEFSRQDFETEKKEWGAYTHPARPELTKETVGAFWAYGRETYHASKNSIGYIIEDYRWWDRDQKQRTVENDAFTAKAKDLLQKCRTSE